MTYVDKLLIGAYLIKQSGIYSSGVQTALKGLGNVARHFGTEQSGRVLPELARGITSYSARGNGMAGDSMKSIIRNLGADARDAAGAARGSEPRNFLAENLRNIRNKQFSPLAGTYERTNWRGMPLSEQQRAGNAAISENNFNNHISNLNKPPTISNGGFPVSAAKPPQPDSLSFGRWGSGTNYPTEETYDAISGARGIN